MANVMVSSSDTTTIVENTNPEDDKLIFVKMILAGFFARDFCYTQNALICQVPGLIEVNELRSRRL